MPEPRLPRWIRILLSILKNWKETIGSAAILFTLYLWYFDRITQEKAIFGIILLVAGGFVTNTIDLIDLFKYVGNYKKNENGNSDK